MIDETMLGGVAAKLDWKADEFLRFTLSNEAEAQYRASTLAAHRRGVFGVPTVVIGDEMWWGNDRLDFVEECMAAQAAAERKAL
jgi:2-hydroxychromene-2-carboxylate isomerase